MRVIPSSPAGPARTRRHAGTPCTATTCAAARRSTASRTRGRSTAGRCTPARTGAPTCNRRTASPAPGGGGSPLHHRAAVPAGNDAGHQVGPMAQPGDHDELARALAAVAPGVIGGQRPPRCVRKCTGGRVGRVTVPPAGRRARLVTCGDRAITLRRNGGCGWACRRDSDHASPSDSA